VNIVIVFYGNCSDGMNGNGKCISCNPDYFGLTCNQICSCDNGSNCDEGVNGYGCFIERCVDPDCFIKCQCFSNNCSSNFNCNNSITILNQTSTLNLSSVLYILGNADVDGSKLNLTTAELKIEKNFTIIYSSLLFDSNSTILVNGCIVVKNISITISLSNIDSNQKKILLLNSSSECLDVQSYSIEYLNAPKCKNITSESDSSSIYIIISEQNCGSTLQIGEIIAIIVGSILGVVLITFAILLSIPKLRYKLLPSAKIRDKRLKRKEEIAVTNNLNTVQDSIK